MYTQKKITFDKNGIIVQIASHAALSQDGKAYFVNVILNIMKLNALKKYVLMMMWYTKMSKQGFGDEIWILKWRINVDQD